MDPRERGFGGASYTSRAVCKITAILRMRGTKWSVFRIVLAGLITVGILTFAFSPPTLGRIDDPDVLGITTTTYSLAWTNLAPVERPSPRGEYAMAYDSESDRVVLFGGSAGGSSAETWALDLDTNNWTRMQPEPSPPPRSLHAMAYDSESDRIIMFGGSVAGERNDETWAYDDNTNAWARISPDVRPLGRTGHAMSYDRESDRVILFGGSRGQPTDETWAFDFNANAWRLMGPVAAPSPRVLHSMAYDNRSDRIILFGGTVEFIGGGVVFYFETWAYDTNAETWTNMRPRGAPTARAWQASSYDFQADRVLIFGGLRSDGVRTDETWTYDYDANVWRVLNSTRSPAPRTAHSMAYDEDSGLSVVFGGYTEFGANDETWAYGLGPRDTTDPVILIVSPPDGAVVDSTRITVRGIASDDGDVAQVEVSGDGVRWTPAVGTSSWSATINLAEGSNTVYATATDLWGNSVAATVTVTVRPLWPFIVIGISAAVAASAVAVVIWRRRIRRRPQWWKQKYLKPYRGPILFGRRKS